MPTITKNVIQVFRGNNKTIVQTIYQGDGETVYPLTGYAVTLYVKRTIKDDNDDAIITLTGTLTEPVNGIVQFYILPAHTNSDEAIANLKDDVHYPYEVEVVTDDVPAHYYTAIRSTFIIITQNR